MNYNLTTTNNSYRVINYLRKDGLYNVYVQRHSNLTDVFKGEATYCIGCKEPAVDLKNEDVINLRYEI